MADATPGKSYLMPDGPVTVSDSALSAGRADENGRLRGFRLLYLVDTGFPTFETAVSALFGRYMHRAGLITDIVARSNDGPAERSAGRLYLPPGKTGRIASQVRQAFHDVTVLVRIRKGAYSAIQVRNKVFIAVIALWTARRLGIPFFYVMSYPMSDGTIRLAREHGRSLGTARWLYWLVKGHAGRLILHRVVLRFAAHVFVQSDRMRVDLAAQKVPLAHMTAIPMGFDPERYQPPPSPVQDERLRGRRIIAYLGTCERVRRVDFLFEVVARLTPAYPNILLLIIGDAIEATDKAWLRDRIAETASAMRWSSPVGLRQVTPTATWATAEVALAMVPPDPLLVAASPTKLVEYLAMGKPVVATDHPDQRQVIEASDAGLCTDFEASCVARAIDTLLSNPDVRAMMGARGKRYVLAERSYETIASRLCGVYASLLSSDARFPKRPT